ncbi:MAG: putative ArsR family transcriptional regulator [Pseudonocardiales bacterium]|nr:putative ArsR family transcriptional regulator [Pseudonocardiales bacterium]
MSYSQNPKAPRTLAGSGASRVGAAVAPPEVGPTEIFRALGDPVRWSIIRQMAAVDELACSTLEDTLNVSKPTISYHTKILVQAGLMSVRRDGRHFFYTLRREVLRALIDDIWLLAPEPLPVRDGKVAFKASSTRRRKAREDLRPEPVDSGEHEAVLLTW